MNREFLEGWDIKKLENVSNMVERGTLSKSNTEYYSGDKLRATVKGIKLLYIKLLDISYHDLDEQAITINKLHKLHEYKVRLFGVYDYKMKTLYDFKKSMLQKDFLGGSCIVWP